MFGCKNFNTILISTVIIGAVMFACLILIIAGVANPFIMCFDVDSQERLYVGLADQIEVYDGRKCVYTINPQTSRGYLFTISDDDTLFLSTATTVYSMDLLGNIVETYEDRGAHVYNEIQKLKNDHTAISGNHYSLVNNLGWSKIVRNDDTVVYRISVFSFFVKVLLFLSSLGLILLVTKALKSKKADSIQNKRKV